MATSTPNLGLTLPIGNEHVSRQIINENMMILDESATNFDFNPDAMRDAILAVQDVTHVKIVLNRSDEEVNGIPAKSLLALVNNGGKTNICQAIYDTNTSGLATTGTLEKEIEGVTIKFSRPSLYALHFNITLEGFTAPSLTNIETSIKNALMTYINRTLQIGEVLSMENVRQIVYNAAGSEAANFRIKDLSCSGSQGVSRDFMDPGWNNKFTMSSGSDVTITSVQSQSSQAIDALNNNINKLLPNENNLPTFANLSAFTTKIDQMISNSPKGIWIGAGYLAWTNSAQNIGCPWSGSCLITSNDSGTQASVLVISPGGQGIAYLNKSAGTWATSWNSFALSNKYVIENKSKAGATVNANAVYDFDFDVTKSGYNAVGVVGTIINSGSTCCLVSSYTSSNTGVRVRVRNTGSSAVTTGSIEIKVLYEKA